MPASASRNPSLCRFGLPLAATVLLGACGGGGVGGVSGGSSGGSNAVLAGTFTKASGSTLGSDHVFGAVNSLGNGYLADLGGSSRALYVFESSSGSGAGSGTINGSFAAYAANGSNLGDGTTLQNGSVSGTVASQSGTTTASVKFANSAFSSSATLVLDQPVLASKPLSVAAGSYSASIGGTTIASTALFTLGGSSYTLSLDSSGGAALASTSGCSLSGSATPDAAYDIYDLHLAGSCNGTSLVLDGQATYLPAGSVSPLDGSTLSNVTLLLELSDFLAGGGSPQYALAGLAGKTS